MRLHSSEISDSTDGNGRALRDLATAALAFGALSLLAAGWVLNVLEPSETGLRTLEAMPRALRDAPLDVTDPLITGSIASIPAPPPDRCTAASP